MRPFIAAPTSGSFCHDHPLLWHRLQDYFHYDNSFPFFSGGIIRIVHMKTILCGSIDFRIVFITPIRNRDIDVEASDFTGRTILSRPLSLPQFSTFTFIPAFTLFTTTSIAGFVSAFTFTFSCTFKSEGEYVRKYDC